MAICPNSLQIDDFNGNIVYSGPWKSFTNQDYGFNGTRHVAAEPGLSANFKFNGSCLFVNGIIGANGSFPMPSTTFVLDGHFTQMNQSVANGDRFPGTQFNSSVFYIAVTMTEGEHELIITNLDGDSTRPLVLDSFIITPFEANPATSPASPLSATNTSVSFTTAAFPPSLSTPSATSSVDGAASSSSSSSSHSHTAAIVGGVVGGVGGLLVLALLALFVLRPMLRRRNAASDHIRPFAAWRGTTNASTSTPTLFGPTAPTYSEKLARQAVPPEPVPSTTDSSGPSEPPDAAQPGGAAGPSAPHPTRRFYGDQKVQPPGYTP